MKTFKKQLIVSVISFIIITVCYVYSESNNHVYECLKIEKGY